MADLFLHLPFARRLRTAEGLHPFVGEALTRRAPLVVLGAILAHLPANDRKAMGFFRRLLSRGGESAKWRKLLSPAIGQPRAELIASLLMKGDDAGGSMMRFALALGVLSADVLDDALSAANANLAPGERLHVERAQARLWLQVAIANPADLQREWRPGVELGEADLVKAAVRHLDRAIARVYAGSPGEAALVRWMKISAAEVADVSDMSKSAGLPAALGLSDAAARAPYFDGPQLLEKIQGAVTRFVFLANRLAERHAPDLDRAAALEALCGGSQELLPAPAGRDALDAARVGWKKWLHDARDAALTRGRNPKPAFSEGVYTHEPRLPGLGATGVMNLSDLPEVHAPGAPPLPELSGPVSLRPPALTQEVSIAQIEAETAAAQAQLAFSAPDSTQEVSVNQIAGETPGDDALSFRPPALTQEVSLAQIEAEARQYQSDNDLAAPTATPAAEPPAGDDAATPPRSTT